MCCSSQFAHTPSRKKTYYNPLSILFDVTFYRKCPETLWNIRLVDWYEKLYYQSTFSKSEQDYIDSNKSIFHGKQQNYSNCPRDASLCSMTRWIHWRTFLLFQSCLDNFIRFFIVFQLEIQLSQVVPGKETRFRHIKEHRAIRQI